MPNHDEILVNQTFVKNKKVAVLIDAQNLYQATVSKTGLKPNFDKILKFLKKLYNQNCDIIYFVGEININQKLNEFQSRQAQTISRQNKKIEKLGYTVQRKEIHFVNSKNDKDWKCDNCGYENVFKQSTLKANVDMDIVHFIYKNFKVYDEFSILTNDGDYYSTIEMLIRNSKFRNIIAVNNNCSGIYKKPLVSRSKIDLEIELDKLQNL